MPSNWTIVGRGPSGTAIAWKRPGAKTITIEKMRRKAAGLGGKRYVARVGSQEFGALDLASAQQWANKVLAKI